MATVRIAEHLAIDLAGERWTCNECGDDLGPADENYKEGCLVAERDPTDVHHPEIDAPFTFAPDPEWCRIVEFYCPNCGTMLENEYLPPGHPITHDLEPDLDALRARFG